MNKSQLRHQTQLTKSGQFVGLSAIVIHVFILLIIFW